MLSFSGAAGKYRGLLSTYQLVLFALARRWLLFFVQQIQKTIDDFSKLIITFFSVLPIREA